MPAAEKTEWLAKFLRRTDGPVLVFVRTKSGAERLARKLASFGLKAAALHADRTQQQRTQAVEGFRSGSYRVLVATDVAARGLDIDGITHVVNYEVPSSRETYVHRVGRTGRADATGTALTLVAPEEAAGAPGTSEIVWTRIAGMMDETNPFAPAGGVARQQRLRPSYRSPRNRTRQSAPAGAAVGCLRPLEQVQVLPLARRPRTSGEFCTHRDVLPFAGKEGFVAGLVVPGLRVLQAAPDAEEAREAGFLVLTALSLRWLTCAR